MRCLQTDKLTKHISTHPSPSRFSLGRADIFVPIRGMFFVRLWLFCWICSALNSPSSGLYFFQLSYFMYPGFFHPALYPLEQRLSRIQSSSVLLSHAQKRRAPSSLHFSAEPWERLQQGLTLPCFQSVTSITLPPLEPEDWVMVRAAPQTLHRWCTSWFLRSVWTSNNKPRFVLISYLIQIFDYGTLQEHT